MRRVLEEEKGKDNDKHTTMEKTASRVTYLISQAGIRSIPGPCAAAMRKRDRSGATNPDGVLERLFTWPGRLELTRKGVAVEH